MVDNSDNISETIEKDKKINQDDLSKIFIKDFLVEKEIKNNPGFVNEIMTSKTISTDLIDEMSLHKGKYPKKFLGLDLDKINISDIKFAISGEYLKLKTAKNLFLAEVKKTYIVDDENKIFSLFEDKNEEKSVNEIYSLINNKKELQKFIVNGIPDIKTIELEKIFSNIKVLNESDIEKKLNHKSSDEKNEIMYILHRVKNNTFSDSDIRGLFEYNILSLKAKQDLIETYIPVINLSRAIEIGLIDSQKAKELKKNIIEKSIDNKIEKETIDELVSYSSFDDIVFKTKELYNENNINLLAKNIGFKNLEENFKSLKEGVISKIKESGPQSLEDMVVELDEINTGNRFNHLEKFKEGNILKYITKDAENNDVISYLEISSIDKDKKELGFKIIGEGSNISLKNSSKTEEKKSFVDFLEGLKQKSSVKLECFLYDDIKKKIKDGDLIESDFSKIEVKDLNDDERNKLTERYIGVLEEDIRNLENEITNSTDENIKKSKQKLLDQKKNNLSLYNLASNDIELSLAFNKLKFIEKLDEIDPDGRNIGFGKGIFFQVEDDIYEVDGFEYTITLKHTISNNIEKDLDFELFFNSFKEKKAKRIEKIENFSSLIERGLVDNKNWENHEIKDGELIAKGVKSGDKTGNQVVDYLVGDKTNELIKINSINGNQVTIQFGERKDFGSLSNDEKKKSKIGKDAKGEKITLENSEYTISLNDLDNLIKKDNLHPSWKTGKTIEPESIKESENGFSGDFISKFFRGTSFKELIMGGKMLIDGIEETLKKGNDLHAAEFAMKLGKFLPGELSEDMQIKVERAQQEQQDKELENLGKVDSPIAVKRIEKWLLNKDTPEYKKEAGLLFMLEKYGHLTAKGALYEYRGKWLWYEAFGGKINDKLFQEIKAQAEASDITFSEEFLVHILLKKQCSGKMPPKRRSRLHKEYEHKWKSGVNDEFEKGYGDAEKKRTAHDIVKSGNDEAMGGTTSNAIGWYKKAVERGGSLEDMSEGFFALLFSGALYDVDQATFLKIKALWEADGNPMIMTRFSTQKSDMILFNKTIVEISKKIEENYKEHEGISEEAKKLFNDALNSNGSEKDRFERTINFWKKHGTPIVRALNMANLADNKYSKTDKIVFLEKENNEVLKKYYDNVRAYTSLDGAFGQGFMDEDCGEVGITGLNVHELTKKYLNIDQTLSFRNKKTGPIIWKEISTDINNTKNKTFDKDPIQNRIKQEKYLVHVFRELTSGIFSVVGSQRVSPYNDNSSNMGKAFNGWGLNLGRDLGNFSPDDIMGGDDKNVNEVLLRTARKVLDGTGIKEEGFLNPFDELTDSTKKATNQMIQNPPLY